MPFRSSREDYVLRGEGQTKRAHYGPIPLAGTHKPAENGSWAKWTEQGGRGPRHWTVAAPLKVVFNDLA